MAAGFEGTGKAGCTDWRTAISSRRLLQFKALAGVSGLQIGVQGLTGVSGLLLVHILEKRQFAAYAIAASLFSSLNVLSDCGIGTALNALGGRAWRDRAALGSLVATALQFRRKLAWVALPFALGFGLLLLRQSDTGWTESLALLLIGLSGIWGIITSNTYAVAFRLAGKYLEAQKLELTTGLIRLALLAAMSLLFINALLAALASSILVNLQGLVFRRIASAVADTRAGPDSLQRLDMAQFVKQQWFSTCYFAFQGQLTIWLMALFGNVDKVAEVGALGRLAVMFAFITGVLNNIATPTLARCDSLARLRRLFLVLLLAYMVFAGALVAAGIAFPHQILWILGRRYAGSASELPLVISTSVVWGLTGVLYALVSARGWIWQAWTSPLITIALQGALLRWLDLAQVRSVLLFGLLSSLPVCLSVTYMAGRGLGISRRKWRAPCSVFYPLDNSTAH